MASDRDSRPASGINDKIGESKDLFGPLQRSITRLEGLHRLAKALSSTIAPSEVADAIIDFGRDVCAAQAVAVFTLSSKGDYGLTRESGAFGSLLGSSPEDVSPVKEAVGDAKIVWVNSRAELVARFPEFAGHFEGRSEICVVVVPFVMEKTVLGGAIGVLGENRSLNSEDLDYGKIFMEQCSQAMHRVQLHAELRRVLAEHQEALAFSETLLSNLPVGFAVVDSRLRFVKLNEAMAEMNGLPVNRILGREIKEIVPPELLPLAEDLVHRVFSTGEVIANLRSEAAATVQRAARCWISTHYPIKDSGNRIVGVGSIAVDITKLKRIEEEKSGLSEEIRRERENLSMLIESVPVIVWQLHRAEDGSFPIDFINSQVERMLGFPKSELMRVASFWPSLIPMEDREIVVSAIERVSQTPGKETSIEHRVRNSKERQLWMSTCFTAIVDSEKRVTSIRGISSDISERKRAEERQQFLSEIAQIVAQSTDYDTILQEAAKLALVRLPGWCSIYLSDADGVLRSMASAHSDRKTEKIFRELAQRFPQKQNDFSSPSIEMVSAFGVKFHMSVPLKARGSILGSILFLRSDSPYCEEDVKFAEELAERIAVSVDNARLLKEVRRANQIKDEFLALLSHELRTPLNAILGWSHLLLAEGVNPELLHQGLTTIQRNSQIQTDLINDLLDVSRIVSGKMNLVIKPVSLKELVENAIRVCRFAAEVQGIQILAELDGELRVSGDASRLQQIFWNLLTNAIKFSKKKGIIEIKLQGNASSVRVTVKDHGKGIASEALPHIFERFYQESSSTTRAYGGLGLGLAIVRQLTELHGGRVWVESDGPDRGACFTVQLPACEPNLSEYFMHASASRMSEEFKSLSGKRALVIDDSEDTRNLVKLMLESRGVFVSVKSSAKGALALFEKKGGNFDFLVSDIGMPDLDGFSLIRQLREKEKLEKRARIPAIALTAYAREEEVDRAKTAGFDLHVAKPVSPVALFESIERALRIQGEPS